MEKQTLEELEKYYRFVGQCNKCKEFYGYDTSKDNGYCPLCMDYGLSAKIRGQLNKLNKINQLQAAITKERNKIASKKDKLFIKKINKSMKEKNKSYHSKVSHNIYKEPVISKLEEYQKGDNK